MTSVKVTFTSAWNIGAVPSSGVTFHVAWNVKGFSGQTEVQLMGSDQMKQMI